MDKSQTPPGRDGSNDPDAGKKEYTAKVTTPKKVAKHGEEILNKAFRDSQRVDPRTGKQMNTKGVAEGRVAQLPTQGADYSKYDTDHLKMMLQPGILHRNEARFKALIRKELQKREQQSQQGVAEGSEPNREAGKAIQNLKNLALMKSALTSQQLAQAGRESIITDAIKACIQFEQSYLQNKQQGNAIFVRALRDEIDNFSKGYPINTSMPEDTTSELGDLLQGKLGKVNFQQGVVEGSANKSGIIL
jgi:hypothetical protein